MPVKTGLSGTADEVEAAFYDAIARGDLDGLMSLWAEDEEIVCIHPNSSRLIGHANIRASWEGLLEQGQVHIRITQLHAVHNPFMSVHSVIETFQTGAQVPQDVHILATNVYIKTPKGWRIATHHASVAAGKAPEELFKASTLH